MSLTMLMVHNAQNKLTQQEQLTKQLRKRQKELKENSGVLTNQKTNFMNLQLIMEMKLKCSPQEFVPDAMKNSGHLRLMNNNKGLGESYTPAHAEYANNANESESKYSKY